MTSKEETLENFMKEFFPFEELKRAGFFTEEMKEDYKAQADRVCHWFGFRTVFEYGSTEVRCHLSESSPTSRPFVTMIKSIYEE